MVSTQTISQIQEKLFHINTQIDVLEQKKKSFAIRCGLLLVQNAIQKYKASGVKHIDIVDIHEMTHVPIEYIHKCMHILEQRGVVCGKE